MNINWLDLVLMACGVVLIAISIFSLATKRLPTKGFENYTEESVKEYAWRSYCAQIGIGAGFIVSGIGGTGILPLWVAIVGNTVMIFFIAVLILMRKKFLVTMSPFSAPEETSED